MMNSILNSLPNCIILISTMHVNTLPEFNQQPFKRHSDSSPAQICSCLLSIKTNYCNKYIVTREWDQSKKKSD